MKNNCADRIAGDRAGLLIYGLKVDIFGQWPAYMVAIMATGLTLWVRLSTDAWLGEAPTLVIFTVPIVLAGYLGGLRAGLLATALSYHRRAP